MNINIANEELNARTVQVNGLSVNHHSGAYILVWLRRALCANHNPAVDLSIYLSNEYQLPVIVFSQVSNLEPYASDRLTGFALGANAALSQGLAKREIQHVFALNIMSEHPLNAQLAEKAHDEVLSNAACVIFDQHFTPYEKAQVSTTVARFKHAIFEVDATRLIPHSQFTKSLHVTKTFRAAHSPLRKKWYALRQPLTPHKAYRKVVFSGAFVDISSTSQADILAMVKSANIDHSITFSQEHPATQVALNKRLAALPSIVEHYRKNRNNPSLPDSTTQLSPYLHFGMTSVFEILAVLEKSDIARAVLWKFLDELLTWREWSHWRLAKKPEFDRFDSLPNSAKNTLMAHASDPREPLLTKAQIFNGETPDDIFNAAQLHWRHTGWLHNNLRMYWATQILRWAKSPQLAWEIATSFNDMQSLDGQDPAVYISMRWAFGESKPAYGEKPIYGWVAKKSDRALKKRSGFEQWVADTLQKYK